MCPSDKCNEEALKNSKTEIKTTKRTIRYLNSISSSTTTISFEYNNRNDCEAPLKKLDNILVTSAISNNNITRFLFTYDYFVSSASDNPAGSYYSYRYPGFEGKRLKLLSLQQKSGDGGQAMPPYLFTYIEGLGQPNLPYKTSYDIDHWGYYNYLAPSVHNSTLVSQGMVGVTRESISDRAAANILKTIKNPMGGITEYEYQPSGNGIRVKKIFKFDDPAKKLVKRYEYQNNPAYSVKPTYNRIAASAGKIVVSTFDFSKMWDQCFFAVNGSGGYFFGSSLLTVWPGPSTITCEYDVYGTSTPYSFLESSQVSPNNYTKITEYEGENGESGKTEYYYPAISYNTGNYPYLPLNKDPQEGNINQKIVYKKVGVNFIKVMENTYTYTFYPGFTYQDGVAVNSGAGLKLDLGFAYPTATVNVWGYFIKSIYPESTTINTKVYDQNDPTKWLTSNETKKFDFYGSLKENILNNNLVSGQGKYTRIFRYYERATTASISLKHKPVEVLSYNYTGDISNPSSKNSFASTFIQYNAYELTQFNWSSNKEVTPLPGLIPTHSSYRKISSYEYGNFRNIVQQNSLLQENINGGFSANFSKASTIWEYNSSIPVAVVSNADKTQIGYNSFESGYAVGSSAGWDSGSSGYNSIIDKNANGVLPQNIFSGRYSVKLNAAPNTTTTVNSPGFTFTPITQSGKYKVSCWIKIELPTGVTKTSLYIYTFKTTAPTAIFPNSTSFKQVFIDISKTDWQYVEAIIDFDNIKLSAGGNGLSLRCFVANSGAYPVYIDDLRIHPVDAQMTTYTYEPGVGKTSEAGPDSKPLHYEYDAFGRLKYVRDFRKNILKKNQYTTAQ